MQKDAETTSLDAPPLPIIRIFSLYTVAHFHDSYYTINNTAKYINYFHTAFMQHLYNP